MGHFPLQPRALGRRWIGAQRAYGSPDSGPERGFALILVLWALVLIAFIVSHVTAAGRTELRIAVNLVENAKLEAAADGGIYAAIFDLSQPNSKPASPVDAIPRERLIGDRRVVVRIEDEAERVNPNLAPPVLLEALLLAVGSDAEGARQTAQAIGEWVGSAPNGRPQPLLLAEYRAAGLPYGPPRSPLESLDELGRVLGVTPAMLRAIRPHLTLYGPPLPDPATEDPMVAAALARLPRRIEIGAVASAMVPDIHTLRITATAFGLGHARSTRRAFVRIGPALPHGYAVLDWSNGPDLMATNGSYFQ